MILQIALNLGLFIALTYADAYWDSQRIKSGKTIKHTLDAIMYTLVACAVILWSFQISGQSVTNQYGYHLAVSWLFVWLSLRWIFFDRWLNRLMNWPVSYYGSTAMLDRFMNWVIKWVPPAFIKVGCLFASSFMMAHYNALYYNSLYPNVEFYTAIVGLVIIIAGGSIVIAKGYFNPGPSPSNKL